MTANTSKTGQRYQISVHFSVKDDQFALLYLLNSENHGQDASLSIKASKEIKRRELHSFFVLLTFTLLILNYKI